MKNFDRAHNAPRISIVGRPNVGKSTLFNRLCRRRRAITDPTPGVTRDSIEENCVLCGKPVILVDTGGVKSEFEGVFDSSVASRSLAELEHAHVILLVLESGVLTAEDQNMVDAVRPWSNKVVLVVNKADLPNKDWQAAEFHSLGLGTPIPVSAEHGRNFGLLEDALFPLLEIHEKREPIETQPEEEEPLTLVLAGKPNTGKSTLANRLVNKDFSLVSEVPGTTRDTVIGQAMYRGRRIRIIDTAGIRRKAKVLENVEYYSVNRAIAAMREADVVALLVDADEGLSDQDKKIAAQAVKKGKAVVLTLNKWDEKIPHPGRFKKAAEKLRSQFPVLEWAPLVPLSALKGYGVENFLDTVFNVDRQQGKRVETWELNKAIAEWMLLTPPPTRQGRPCKVKYLTQVSVKPVRFVAFVNRPEEFKDFYRRFLVNSIRRDFGFESVPVTLEIRGGKK